MGLEGAGQVLARCLGGAGTRTAEQPAVHVRLGETSPMGLPTTSRAADQVKAVHHLASERCKRCGRTPHFVAISGETVEFYCTADLPLWAAEPAVQRRPGR